jgi:hypothetical protein
MQPIEMLAVSSLRRSGHDAVKDIGDGNNQDESNEMPPNST